MTENLAPIALFVFKRAEKTENTLRALAECSTFLDRPLYIFSDAPRTAAETGAVDLVRAVIDAFPHPKKIIRNAPSNKGLAHSIIDGVTELCAKHGRVIVIEDDLIVSPCLLDYFDESLDAYENDARVMQISGFAFGSKGGDNQAYFLPITTSWGWATWQRAWQEFDPMAIGAKSLDSDPALRYRFNVNGLFDYSGMLARHMRGEVDSWAIRWYLSVFLKNGLVLYPSDSLVRNDGFDQSGTHGFRSALLWRKQSNAIVQKKPQMPVSVELAPDAIKLIARFVDPIGLRRLMLFMAKILSRVKPKVAVK